MQAMHTSHIFSRNEELTARKDKNRFCPETAEIEICFVPKQITIFLRRKIINNK